MHDSPFESLLIKKAKTPLGEAGLSHGRSGMGIAALHSLVARAR